MNRILVSLVLLISTACIADAQWFRRGSSGYQKTANGWNYYGKHYELGVDGPVSSTCNCPMCQQLRAALRTKQVQTYQYVPQIIYKPLKQEIVKVEDVYSQDIATPTDSITQMLKILNIQKGEYLVDPGCGDARILVEAEKRYGARCLGIEINRGTYEKAKSNVEANELDNTFIIHGDSRDFSFKNVDYVTLFLFPSLIEELAPKFRTLKSGAKVISYQHEIPLEGTKKIGDFYLWVKP